MARRLGSARLVCRILTLNMVYHKEHCPQCYSDDTHEELPDVVRCDACGHVWMTYLGCASLTPSALD